MDIVKELMNGANDPMWDAHCEMPKRLVKAAADEIIKLRELLIVAVKELECGDDRSIYTKSICADARKALGLQ